MKRHTSAISDQSKNLVDKVMADRKERTKKDIIKDMYKLIDEYKKRKKGMWTYRAIPTQNQAQHYVANNPIYESRLYWCLKRCIEKNIDERFFLFI